MANEPNVVLVFGGPPCQNVSLIGTTGRKAATAERKRFAPVTYVAFRDIVKSLRTRFFVMENVPGLFAAADGCARKDILEDFSDLYANREVHVEAHDHGVPQRRHRILIVGVLKGKNAELAEIALDFLVGRLMTPLERPAWSATFGEAVSDLPAVEPSDGQEFGKHHAPGTVQLSAYQETLKNGSDLIFNHVARPNNERDLELYALLRPGEIAWDAHEKYHRQDLMIYRNDVFLDKYRRQVWDAPSTTVVAHLAKDGHMFIHPRQVRSITVREARGSSRSPMISSSQDRGPNSSARSGTQYRHSWEQEFDPRCWKPWSDSSGSEGMDCAHEHPPVPRSVSQRGRLFSSVQAGGRRCRLNCP